MHIVIIGLSITSAWGNGHASTFRSLTRALHRRGHRILFLERDVPWYAHHRDARRLRYASIGLYRDLAAFDAYRPRIEAADVVIVGSYVPEGPALIDRVLAWTTGVSAFYDIDTPVTLAALATGDAEYLRRDQIEKFDLYWSFSGGPSLHRLAALGARRPRPLYCSVDEVPPMRLLPECWRLGYIGTYSEDRQAALDRHLIAPANRLAQARFVVAGAKFPKALAWPSNVQRIDHVPPDEHAAFFASQRFTLNLTRRAMIDAGYSPSVRLFEAAAAGVAIISDRWEGLDTFFTPGREILVSDSTDETIRCLTDLGDTERLGIAAAARARVLAQHTSAHRAAGLEADVAAVRAPSVLPIRESDARSAFSEVIANPRLASAGE